MAEARLTREQLLRAGLLAAPVVVAARTGGTAPALAATPACGDADDLTPEQTAGPYYKPSSPRRTDIRAGAAGTPLRLTGRVLGTDCTPRRGALVDFWQADARGRYDNEGYRFRGHQRTDGTGRFVLDTVVPGLYPGRTRHIHVLVAAGRGEPLITQLYFPGEPANAADRIYDPALRVKRLRKTARGWTARFDFVLA